MTYGAVPSARPSAWQPNPGRDSTYRGGKSVQIPSAKQPRERAKKIASSRVSQKRSCRPRNDGQGNFIYTCTECGGEALLTLNGPGGSRCPARYWALPLRLSYIAPCKRLATILVPDFAAAPGPGIGVTVSALIAPPHAEHETCGWN